MSKDEPKYIGTKEAAEIIGYAQTTVSRYCREGRFKSADQDAPGSPWRILEEEVREYAGKGRKK